MTLAAHLPSELEDPYRESKAAYRDLAVLIQLVFEASETAKTPTLKRQALRTLQEMHRGRDLGAHLLGQLSIRLQAKGLPHLPFKQLESKLNYLVRIFSRASRLGRRFLGPNAPPMPQPTTQEEVTHD